jgi:hypothetical protein
LKLSALKVVLECENLQTLEIPEHLKKRVDELDVRDRLKFNKVINHAGGDNNKDDDVNGASELHTLV